MVNYLESDKKYGVSIDLIEDDGIFTIEFYDETDDQSFTEDYTDEEEAYERYEALYERYIEPYWRDYTD